jgi:hypothetical protein
MSSYNDSNDDLAKTRKSRTSLALDSYSPDEKTSSSVAPNNSSSAAPTTNSTVEIPIGYEAANRFKATLEEAVEKLEVLGLITQDSLRRRKDFTSEPTAATQTQQRTRKDIFSTMQRQRELEHKFEQLQNKRNSLRGLANKSKYLANQAELRDLTKELKLSTAAINLNLRDHPTIVGNLQKIQRERTQLQGLLKTTISELDSGYFSSILSQINQLSGEQKLLGETKLRAEKTAQAVKQLQNELENEWKEFERFDEHKNNQISQLTAQLKHLKKVTQLTGKFEQQTAISQAETLARVRDQRLEELRSKISAAKALHKVDRRVNKRTISYLTRQREQFDQLHSDWEAKYSTDYADISRNYDQLSAQRHSDQISLISLQQRWSNDQAHKKLLIEEDRKRAENAARRTQLDAQEYLAACRIQFAWRVYWRRRRKELIKLRKKRLARMRAEKAAENNPIIAMQRRQKEAEKRKADKQEG